MVIGDRDGASGCFRQLASPPSPSASHERERERTLTVVCFCLPLFSQFVCVCVFPSLLPVLSFLSGHNIQLWSLNFSYSPNVYFLAFPCPSLLKAPLVCCFFPQGGWDKIAFLFMGTCISSFCKGLSQKKKVFFLSDVYLNIEQCEIDRQLKWYLIICLEILTHLKDSLSQKSLWMAIRVPNSLTYYKGSSLRHHFLAGLTAPFPPASCFDGHSTPGSYCSNPRTSK